MKLSSQSLATRGTARVLQQDLPGSGLVFAGFSTSQANLSQNHQVPDNNK